MILETQEVNPSLSKIREEIMWVQFWGWKHCQPCQIHPKLQVPWKRQSPGHFPYRSTCLLSPVCNRSWGPGHCLWGKEVFSGARGFALMIAFGILCCHDHVGQLGVICFTNPWRKTWTLVCGQGQSKAAGWLQSNLSVQVSLQIEWWEENMNGYNSDVRNHPLHMSAS